MTECNNCRYFIGYSNGAMTCLMKNEFCIISGKTSYPKDCEDFKGDVE